MAYTKYIILRLLSCCIFLVFSYSSYASSQINIEAFIPCVGVIYEDQESEMIRNFLDNKINLQSEKGYRTFVKFNEKIEEFLIEKKYTWMKKNLLCAVRHQIKELGYAWTKTQFFNLDVLGNNKSYVLVEREHWNQVDLYYVNTQWLNPELLYSDVEKINYKDINLWNIKKAEEYLKKSTWAQYIELRNIWILNEEIVVSFIMINDEALNIGGIHFFDESWNLLSKIESEQLIYGVMWPLVYTPLYQLQDGTWIVGGWEFWYNSVSLLNLNWEISNLQKK